MVINKVIQCHSYEDSLELLEEFKRLGVEWKDNQPLDKDWKEKWEENKSFTVYVIEDNGKMTYMSSMEFDDMIDEYYRGIRSPYECFQNVADFIAKDFDRQPIAEILRRNIPDDFQKTKRLLDKYLTDFWSKEDNSKKMAKIILNDTTEISSFGNLFLKRTDRKRAIKYLRQNGFTVEEDYFKNNGGEYNKIIYVGLY